MPLFACRECCCIENTALSNYWSATTLDKSPALCSACDPEMNRWHGAFKRRTAAGMFVDEQGQLWSNLEGVPKHYKILGTVSLPQENSHV